MTEDKPTSGLGSTPKRLQPKPVQPTGPDPFITGNHRTPDGRVQGVDKRAPLPGSRQEKEAAKMQRAVTPEQLKKLFYITDDREFMQYYGYLFQWTIESKAKP